MTTRTRRSYERLPHQRRSLSADARLNVATTDGYVSTFREGLTTGYTHPSQGVEGSTNLSPVSARLDQGITNLPVSSTVGVNEGLMHLTPQQESTQGSTYLEPVNDDAHEGNTNLSGEQTNTSTTQTAETVMLPSADRQLMTEDVRETAGGGLPSTDNVLPRPVDLEQEEITDIRTDLSEYITPHA